MERRKGNEGKNKRESSLKSRKKRRRQTSVSQKTEQSEPDVGPLTNKEIIQDTSAIRECISRELLDFYLYGYKYNVLQAIEDCDNTDSISRNPARFPAGMHRCRSSIPGYHFGVYCSRLITVGTWIGPYEGEVVRPDQLTSTRDNEHMWEIYKDGKLSHYVDGSDPKFSNWMSSIRCARHKDEQNMTVFQYSGNLYYKAFRDIMPGSELLVWYDDRYTDNMDMCSLSMARLDDAAAATFQSEFSRQLSAGLSNNQEEMEFSNEYLHGGDHQWNCGQCGHSFTQRVALEMHVCKASSKEPYQCGQCLASFATSDHLRSHVVQHVSDKPFKCGYCARTFSGSTTLGNHIRKHTGETPFGCKKCGKYFSQSTQLSRHEKSHDT